jgi:hypothetical protein
MWTLWSFILALLVAPLIGKHAGDAAAGATA